MSAAKNTKNTSRQADVSVVVVRPPGPWYRQRVPVGFCLHMFFIFILNQFPVPVWFLCLCLGWHEVYDGIESWSLISLKPSLGRLSPHFRLSKKDHRQSLALSSGFLCWPSFE